MLRKLTKSIVVVVAISMLFVPVAFAQKSQVPLSIQGDIGAWQIGIPGTMTPRGEDAIVVESGKVLKMGPTAGVKDGWEMKFRTDQGNDFRVFLGPKWFVENQSIKFMPGDSVTIRGKKRGAAIIAVEVSKNDWTMKLRNEEDGQPSWVCCYPGTVAEK